MADFGFANKSNSSDFSSTGDKVNEVFGDLLLNRTELEAMITSLKRRQYGATPPANPNTGDIWECSTTGGGYTANVVYRYNGSAWAELIASAVNIPNRNTVIQGKVTAAGLPDLFEAGTGLAVKLNSTATPAIFAFMNGNSTSLGTVDIVAAVSADAATFWSSLPTSSTVYLYVDYTTGTVSGGFTTLAPVYQNIAPTHSAGLHWLDFNTGKVWSSDGSAWTQRNRIFVGTATTDGSGVTAVDVYAYNVTQEIKANDIITKGPWVDVRAFGAVGDGVTDDTTAIQAAIDYAAACNREITLCAGQTYATTAPLTMAQDKTVLHIPKGAVLKPLFPVLASDARNPINITGEGCTVYGEGQILNPAYWFYTTSPAAAYLSTIFIDGAANCNVFGITIENVPMIGIRSLDANDVRIEGVTINGNMATWDVNHLKTVHFGVVFNADDDYPGGNFVMTNCTVRGCVQGVDVNTSSSNLRGLNLTISQNIFEDCWDHGIYGDQLTHGLIITGNQLYNCANGIAVSGDNHIVDGNIVIYDGTGVVDWCRTPISGRDCSNSIISNNIIKCNVTESEAAVAIGALYGATVNNNLIINNYIDTGDLGCVAVRIRCYPPDTALEPMPLEMTHNSIIGNIVKTVGYGSFGSIAILAYNHETPSGRGYMNSIKDNQLIVKGVLINDSYPTYGAYGIKTEYQNQMTVSGNTVTYEGNPTVAGTKFNGIQLANSSYANVFNNQLFCTEGFGTNTTIIGLNDMSGCTYNHYHDNFLDLSSTDLDGATKYVMQATSKLSKLRLSYGAMQGRATVLAGQTTLAVTNANVLTTSIVLLTPANADGAAKPAYAAIAADGAFTVTIGSAAAAGGAIYNWQII